MYHAAVKEASCRFATAKQHHYAAFYRGDIVAYYSPTATFQGKEKQQSFTAIGIVSNGSHYTFDMGGGLCPFRHDVAWFKAEETPIRPMLELLEFALGNPHWGYQLGFGRFSISFNDMRTIASAMKATVFSNSSSR